MRSLRIASAVVVSAVLVAGLSACNSMSSGGDAAASAPAKPAELDPKAALLASAAVMDKAGTAKLAISGGSDGPGSGTLAWKSPQAVELNVKSDGQDVAIRIIGDVMYMQAPPEVSSKVGKHWLQLDQKSMAAMDKQSGGGEDLSMMGSIMQLFNPAVELTAAAQGGKVTKVGTEQIDGAETVHYKAEVPVDVVLAQMPSLSADMKKKMHDELTKDGPTTNNSEFWINGKNELVQMGGTDFNPTKGAAAAAKSADVTTIKYSAIGSATAPAAPSAADTLNFAEFMKSMGAK